MFIIVRKAEGTIVDHPNSGSRYYQTERAAKANRTRMFGRHCDQKYVIMDEKEYVAPMIKVKNLMSGKEVEIDANTPWCCRPDSEAFWSN
jgi:hypothetical protein